MEADIIEESRHSKYGGKQIEELNEIVLKNKFFTEETEFSNKFRSKTSKISHWMRTTNPWSAVLINQMPDPNMYDTYEKFNSALQLWYRSRPRDIDGPNGPLLPEELQLNTKFITKLPSSFAYTPSKNDNFLFEEQ